MSKLIYIANARIPTERAHGFQMMTMCSKFADLGNEVVLLAPTRNNKIHEDAFSYYNLEKTFSVVYLPCPDLLRYGRVGFLITTWIFAYRAAKEALRRNFDWVYSRDGRSLWVLSLHSKKYGWEIHDDQRKWWAKRVLKHGMGFVTTNKALVPLHQNFVGEDVRAVAVPNGVELEEFVREKSRDQIRREIGLDPDQKMVLYTGHLYTYKGVDTLAMAAAALPEFEFYFIGGTQADIENFKSKYERYKNIHILGHKQHSQVFLFMRAANLLVIPNSAKDEFSTLYTSPIKLFEYIGSGTPIVASDLPSIREVVDEREVYFFKPDDATSLINTIQTAMKDGAGSQDKAAAALHKAESLTWRNRAIRILNFFAINHVQ